MPVKKNVTTLILGGGQGKRLFPLTHYRSKPAVPIGSKYRLVDIPISNCLNSDLNRIFVLTQFNSTSLHRHIHRAYPYEHFTQTSIELLAAEQTLLSTDWFQGTADAVRKHMSHYMRDEVDTVLILSGDHLYRMDYREILKFHQEKDADVTVATVPVPKKDVSGFGIMKIRTDSRITDFMEKPSAQEKIDSYIMPKAVKKVFSINKTTPVYLASMGVYVFKADVLRKVLEGNETDFGKEVIPKAIGEQNVYGYVFSGYWRDIGTIESFHEASVNMTKPDRKFKFLSDEGRVFTRPRYLPPAIVESSKLHNVQLAEGCIIQGADIEETHIGLRAMIGEGTTIKRSVVMGNDYYVHHSSGRNQIGIGKNCFIKNCIIDKNVWIDNDVRIENKKKIKYLDGDGFYIRDGIVIVPKGARLSQGLRI